MSGARNKASFRILARSPLVCLRVVGGVLCADIVEADIRRTDDADKVTCPACLGLMRAAVMTALEPRR